MAKTSRKDPKAAASARRVALTEIEAMELRLLDGQHQLARANSQAAEALLRARAQQIAKAHGIDLSAEALGNWTLSVDRGEFVEGDG